MCDDRHFEGYWIGGMCVVVQGWRCCQLVVVLISDLYLHRVCIKWLGGRGSHKHL